MSLTYVCCSISACVVLEVVVLCIIYITKMSFNLHIFMVII